MIIDDKHNYLGSWLPVLSSFCCWCAKQSQCFQFYGQKFWRYRLHPKGRTARSGKQTVQGNEPFTALSCSCGRLLLLKHQVFKMHLNTLQSQGQSVMGSEFHYSAVKPTDRKTLAMNQLDWLLLIAVLSRRYHRTQDFRKLNNIKSPKAAKCSIRSISWVCEAVGLGNTLLHRSGAECLQIWSSRCLRSKSRMRISYFCFKTKLESDAAVVLCTEALLQPTSPCAQICTATFKHGCMEPWETCKHTLWHLAGCA